MQKFAFFKLFFFGLVSFGMSYSHNKNSYTFYTNFYVNNFKKFHMKSINKSIKKFGH